MKNAHRFLKIVGAFIMFALMTGSSINVSAKEVALTEENFPDAFFREYVTKKYDKDVNGILSEEERMSASWIDVKSGGTCTSLVGIEYLENLHWIDCEKGNVESLDVSMLKKLEILELYDFGVKELNVSGCDSLQTIILEDMPLRSVDISKCYELESFTCKRSQLEKLEVKNLSHLKSLNCSNNQLSEMELDNPRLTTLILTNNSLRSLDLSGVPNLESLSISGNLLETLDLTKTPYVDSLYCKKNLLKTLDCSGCLSLKTLACDGNQLTDLNVKNCKVLDTLYCKDNHLMALDLTDNNVLGVGYEIVTVSDQSVELEADENGNVNFNTYLNNEEVANIKKCTKGTFQEGIFTPKPGENIFGYTYDCGPTVMEVIFTIIPHKHVLEHKEKLLPDCIHDGHEAYYMCDGCGKWYEDKAATKEITDHDSVIIPMTGEHAYDQGSITKKPTCQKEGVMTYTCSGCGEKKTEPIKKVSHEYENVVKRASFSKNGKIETTCKYCKKVKETIEIAGIKKIKVDKAVYNGKKQKPTVTLSDKNGGEISAYLYSMKYQKNPVKVGSYTVTITLKGIYYGEKKVTYTIQPKSTKIKVLKADKKAFTMQWNKVTAQTDGYEFQYSTTKKFTGSTTKTVKVKKNTETKKTVKNLKSKQKYFVRVRTCKKVNGKTYYSDWSEIKSVMTK